MLVCTHFPFIYSLGFYSAYFLSSWPPPVPDVLFLFNNQADMVEGKYQKYEAQFLLLLLLFFFFQFLCPFTVLGVPCKFITALVSCSNA